MKSAQRLTNYWSLFWCFHFEKDYERLQHDAIVPGLRESRRRRYCSRFRHVIESFRSTTLTPPAEHRLEWIAMEERRDDYVIDLFGRRESFAVPTNRLEAKHAAKMKWWFPNCVETFYYRVQCKRETGCHWTPAENRRHPLEETAQSLFNSSAFFASPTDTRIAIPRLTLSANAFVVIEFVDAFRGRIVSWMARFYRWEKGHLLIFCIVKVNLLTHQFDRIWSY